MLDLNDLKNISQNQKFVSRYLLPAVSNLLECLVLKSGMLAIAASAVSPLTLPTAPNLGWAGATRSTTTVIFRHRHAQPVQWAILRTNSRSAFRLGQNTKLNTADKPLPSIQLRNTGLSKKNPKKKFLTIKSLPWFQRKFQVLTKTILDPNVRIVLIITFLLTTCRPSSVESIRDLTIRYWQLFYSTLLAHENT